MDDVLQRLVGMLGKSPGWHPLMSYLPEAFGEELMLRSAVAATFSASLELAKQGKAQMRQKDNFGTIYLRGAKDAKATAGNADGGES